MNDSFDLDEQCPACRGVGHVGPATGAEQRDYGRECRLCDGEGVVRQLINVD